MGKNNLLHRVTKEKHKEVLDGMGFFQRGVLNLSFDGNALEEMVTGEGVGRSAAARYLRTWGGRWVPRLTRSSGVANSKASLHGAVVRIRSKCNSYEGPPWTRHHSKCMDSLISLFTEEETEAPGGQVNLRWHSW